MKQYKYILLDWDGNLAKTLDLWLGVFRQVLNDEGFHPSDEEIASSFGNVSDYFTKLGIKNPNELYDKADQIGKDKLPDVELYPEALEVLNYFRQKDKKTALITSSRYENVAHLLDKYNMNSLFDTLVTRYDVEHQKPHPESLLSALEKLGGNKKEALMVGDSDKDLGAAKNAGIDSVLFYPLEHKKFYNLKKLKALDPTYIVEDFREIMRIVN